MPNVSGNRPYIPSEHTKDYAKDIIAPPQGQLERTAGEGATKVQKLKLDFVNGMQKIKDDLALIVEKLKRFASGAFKGKFITDSTIRGAFKKDLKEFQGLVKLLENLKEKKGEKGGSKINDVFGLQYKTTGPGKTAISLGEMLQSEMKSFDDVFLKLSEASNPKDLKKLTQLLDDVREAVNQLTANKVLHSPPPLLAEKSVSAKKGITPEVPSEQREKLKAVPKKRSAAEKNSHRKAEKEAKDKDDLIDYAMKIANKITEKRLGISKELRDVCELINSEHLSWLASNHPKEFKKLMDSFKECIEKDAKKLSFSGRDEDIWRAFQKQLEKFSDTKDAAF